MGNNFVIFNSASLAVGERVKLHPLNFGGPTMDIFGDIACAVVVFFWLGILIIVSELIVNIGLKHSKIFKRIIEKFLLQ